jgi:hypothetical protein
VNELLQLAVDAHGGLDRWNALTTAQMDMSITGAIWAVKGKPDVFREVSLEAQMHREYLVVSPVSGVGRAQRAGRQTAGARDGCRGGARTS